jgi:hypothetical protein
MPAALTTVSHSIISSPRSAWCVCTDVTRRPVTVIDVTFVSSTMRTPRLRAPRAIAWVTLDGSM